MLKITKQNSSLVIVVGFCIVLCTHISTNFTNLIAELDPISENNENNVSNSLDANIPHSSTTNYNEELILVENPPFIEQSGPDSWFCTPQYYYATYSIGSYISLNSPISTNTDYVTAMYLNDLASLPIPGDAAIEIDWTTSFGTTGSFANFEYSLDGGSNWHLFYDAVEGFAQITSSESRATKWSLAYNQLEDDSSTYLIRMQVYFSGSSVSEYVRINSIKIQDFQMSISDASTNGNLTNYEDNLPVSVNFKAYDNYGCSDYPNQKSCYRLHYGTNPTVTSSDEEIYANADLFSTDFENGEGNFKFTIPIDTNGRIYYRFRITEGPLNPTTILWSDTYAVDCYDNEIPQFENINFLSTNETFEHWEPLDIRFNLADTGGSKLDNITCYWGIDNPSVSNTTNNGSVFARLYQHAELETVSIPTEAFKLGSITYFRFYLYDRVGNVNVSKVYSIHPNDISGPNIYLEEGTDTDQEYYMDKLINVSISEPEEMVGVNSSSVVCILNINSNNFTEGFVRGNSSHYEDNWEFEITQDEIAYNDTVFIWLYAEDLLGNPSWNNFSFEVVDTVNPSIQLLEQYSTLTNITTNDSLILVYQCIEPSDAAGIVNVTLHYDVTLPGAPTISISAMPTEVNGSIYTFNVPSLHLTAGTFVVLIKASDNAGNYATLTRNIPISSLNATADGNDGDGTDTMDGSEGDKDLLPFPIEYLYYGGGGAVALIGVVGLAKKLKKA